MSRGARSPLTVKLGINLNGKPLLTSKCKKTILFLVPIFASVIVNITVGCCTSLMFFHRVDLRGDSSEAGRSVPKVLITFGVFSGLAAASCSPLMIRYGFRKVALGGSVLHICSSVFSSLTTTADILSILFGIMRGFAVGLLRTIGVVATVDHLYTRPALALLISHTSFTVGNIIGITAIVVGFSHGWDLSHTMRAFEISAVIGLVAGSFLQKNSQTQQNASKLFKHPKFYYLLSIRLAASVGLSISMIVIRINNWSIVTQFVVLVILVIIRNFQREKLNKSALLSMGISVLALGVVTMAIRGALAVSFLLGAATAFSQIMLPLALVNTTGRSNLKLALPVLGCFEEMGGNISSLLLAQYGRIPCQPDEENLYWYEGDVLLIIAGVGAVILFVMMKRWTPLSNTSGEEDGVEETDDHVDKAEDYMQDPSN
ncbi:uncharacterized protein [Haliotis cracherodii]|uniref:uncharacterized protein n=1 Tax=Haliotis cracherodii TaxID=6455 RepID=UPI0039E96EBD